MSSTTPSPGTTSSVGRHWTHISPGGSARIADGRVHGTAGELPIERFRRAEASALRAIDGRAPFRQIRELVRRVQADCAVEIGTNAHSAPWRLIGETVRVVIAGGRVSIRRRDREAAAHAGIAGRRQRVVDPAHPAGIGRPQPAAPPPPAAASGLLRPLSEYQRAAGGAWRWASIAGRSRRCPAGFG